jgi:4-amino-4-deoxy-L-arabinose transferase-like glycosyltransferase
MFERISRLASSVWLVAFVALLLRLAYLAYMAHLIPAVVLAAVPFQNEVGNVASALAQGHGFCCLFRQPTGPTAWLSPVYPLIVAAIFKIFGIFTLRSFYAAVSLNCLFSAAATVPLFYAAKRFASPRTATVAGWIWAIFPAGIILPFEWIWDTSLSVLLAAALLWSTLPLKDRSRQRDFALYGLLWGLALLTNPALGALLPFLIGWVLYQHRANRSQELRLGLLTCAVLVLTCLPWTIRNYVQFHRFIPLRSNFPYEFWSGNNEIFDENSREVNRITRYEQVHLYAEQGENEFLNDKLHRALHFVRAHPALYAQLFVRRIIATWFGTESPWQDFADSDSKLVRFLLAWNALALLGMIAGLMRLYLLRREYFFPIASFPVIFPLTFYIAHTTLRHRHPCDPVVALLMAAAITGVQRQVQANSVESSKFSRSRAHGFAKEKAHIFRK